MFSKNFTSLPLLMGTCQVRFWVRFRVLVRVRDRVRISVRIRVRVRVLIRVRIMVRVRVHVRVRIRVRITVRVRVSRVLPARLLDRKSDLRGFKVRVRVRNQIPTNEFRGFWYNQTLEPKSTQALQNCRKTFYYKPELCHSAFVLFTYQVEVISRAYFWFVL